MLESETLAISQDEPALSLWEGDITSTKAGAGIRRVQIIRVIRKDQIVEFRTDIGPAAFSISMPFYVPGGVVIRKDGVVTPMPERLEDKDIQKIEIFHTVAELLELSRWQKGEVVFTEQVEPQGLLEGYAELVEQSRIKMKGRL